MITSSGKVLEYHGQKYCVTCKQIRDHTCFWMSYRKSESSDDAYRKEERWNCDRCHTHKILNYVETIWTRSKKYPLVYDTLDKSFFRFFLYLHPASTEHLKETQEYRRLERENLSHLMTIFVEEVLDNRFEIRTGIYKIEQRLAENPNSISSNHLASYRICRAAPMIVWTGQLQKAMVLLLKSYPGYFKNDWAEERPLWIEIPDDQWSRIRKMIKVVRDHQIWMEKNNQEIVNAISSTKQKDWKEILLDGRLPDRTEQLLAPLIYNKIHEAAIN